MLALFTGYLEKDYVESLMNPASEYKADIVEGSYQTINKDEKFIDKSDLHASAFQDLYGYPWGKVYRRSLLQEIVAVVAPIVRA